MLCPLLLPGRPVLIDDESRSCPPPGPKQSRGSDRPGLGVMEEDHRHESEQARLHPLESHE